MNRIITLLVGESGSGKTSIAEELETRYQMKSLWSYTTRPPRYEGETGHVFVTEEEADVIIANEDIVGYTEFDGHRYFATAAQVNDSDIYVIDPAGVKRMFAFYKGPKRIKVIYIDADAVTRYERMVKRGDTEDAAYQRITHDLATFGAFKTSSFVDKIVQNKNFNKAVRKIRGFIVGWELWALCE